MRKENVDLSIYKDGLERYPIPNTLTNFLEKCTYEKNRYMSFLKLINSDFIDKYMTREEYESSLEYFQNLCAEANATFNAALESVQEIYSDIVTGRRFEIDFIDSCIVIKDDPIFDLTGYINNLHRNVSTQYNDFIARIYDDENITMEINGSHVMNITMQVTDYCNMACTYCYQHNKGKHSMSIETGQKFIDMIMDGGPKTNKYMDGNKLTGIILDFIGGEPFLEVELIDQVCEYFIAQLFKRKHHWVTKFMFSFSSNGLLYFDERVQNYINKYASFVSIGISIDGNKKLHDACRVDLAGNGTYDRAIAAAQDLMKKHGGDGTKMTISPENVPFVFDALVNMVELNYRNIHLNCVYEEGWNFDHASILYGQLIKIVDYLDENGLLDNISVSMLSDTYYKAQSEEDDKNWCGGSGLMMAVDYKGDIYPCLRYMESSVGDNAPPYILGNIEDGICNSEIGLERLECMKCVTRRSQSTDECFNCPIGTGCGWCSAYNYECFGTINKRATFICCMHKAQSLANCYYLYKKNGKGELNCPKEWALDIISEEEYNKLLSYCE